ncbi:MAG: LLM class flavin-dependent oxidoreductase [Acidobacteriota bacterium]
MKVGVLQFFSWPDRETPLEEVYRRAERRVAAMDDGRYDAIWLAEHHFTGYSVCPSVHVMAAHLAARTQRLRIGTAVTLAALYQPLRIAEEIALLDVLSDGRVNFGAGPGFEQREFDAFGVTRDEAKPRFREAVALVQKAWTEERLDFAGDFFTADDVEVLPKPTQRPHPPTWVAATSEGSVRWAASQGYQILMDPHSPHAEIARKRSIYFDALAEAGHSTAERVLPVARLVAVAPTDRRAREIAERAARWTAKSYIGQKTSFFRPGKAMDTVEHYLADTMIYGSPERVAAQLLELETTVPLDYLLLSPLSEETFRLFDECVMPLLQPALATSP